MTEFIWFTLGGIFGLIVMACMAAANNPDHYAEELADVIITALSAAGLLEIDIGTAVSQKILFNRCRPYQHL